jgi:predicted CxxxxCH...CXXCH cytochrome family protein
MSREYEMIAVFIKKCVAVACVSLLFALLGCTEDPLGNGTGALTGQAECLACHTEDGPLISTDIDAGVSEILTGHARHQEIGIDCGTCHVVPAAGDKSHIGHLPAKVVFSKKAALGSSSPSWNAKTHRCEGVYCHGGASQGGTDNAPSFADSTDRALSCTSCHGNPPNTGAHAIHIAKGYACEECHVRPSVGNIAPHVDGSPAEITFGPKAMMSGATPSYNPSLKTCSQVYCHGAMLSGGLNLEPTWASPSGNTLCNSCHGNPPPAPHNQTVTDCSMCHSDTVNEDGTINLIGGLHINGTIDY